MEISAQCMEYGTEFGGRLLGNKCLRRVCVKRCDMAQGDGEPAQAEISHE